MVLLIVAGIPLLNLLWWSWADFRVRHFRHAGVWRAGVAGFAGLNLAVYVAILLPRLFATPIPLPTPVLSAAYIWNLVGLPLATLVVVGDIVAGALRSLRAAAGRGRSAANGDPPETAGARAPAVSENAPGRRQVLTAALVAAPPLAVGLGVGYATRQLREFRVRRLDVPLSNLPPPLDGMTIAHLSDLHVGRFTRGRILSKIVERTNALRADLVVMSGDLIDYALADLPAGLDVLRRLEARAGLFVCEGNHDLFESRREFEERVKAAGVGLLLNEAATTTVRGWPVQVLGIQWGGPGRRHDAMWQAHVQRVLPLRDPAAFPILLAHHPHAFDAAAEAGLPLTLAGHTHGGQLMLTSQLGAGSLLFKYVSGLYQRGNAALVVSNGVGNWLPLRVNAPAEILHLTLRYA